MTGPRDWDKELAEIDKVIAGNKNPAPLPATQTRALSAPSAAPPSTGATTLQTRGRDKLAVWARALLGVAAAVALPFWPYGKSCGTMLDLYLLSAIAIAIVGVWTMRASWTHRRGIAHAAGLLVLLAGLSFAAFEIFQRTAYAALRLGWGCS